MSDYYGVSSTKAIDADGLSADICESILERYIEAGKVWRLGCNYQTLASTGDKLFITFKTPVVNGFKHIHYLFSTVNKTGNEVIFTLNEGGVVANGTAVAPWNLNRLSVAVCPLVDVKAGLSTDAQPMSVTGGVNAPENMLAGSAMGASRPGGFSSGAAFIKLKSDTVYTVIFEAKGAVTMTAFFDIAII
jgi:hypothetical protein